jgi:hypothetical protein
MSKRVQELEASCKEQQKKAAGLEAQLREEVARSAPLYGSNLERMTAAQLEGLARLHERGLKQARALQVLALTPHPFADSHNLHATHVCLFRCVEGAKHVFTLHHCRCPPLPNPPSASTHLCTAHPISRYNLQPPSRGPNDQNSCLIYPQSFTTKDCCLMHDSQSKLDPLFPSNCALELLSKMQVDQLWYITALSGSLDASLNISSPNASQLRPLPVIWVPRTHLHTPMPYLIGQSRNGSF